jgi:hypothetical protein
LLTNNTKMALNNGDLYKLYLFLANKTSLGGNARVEDFINLIRINNNVLLRELTGITNDFGLGLPQSRRQKGLSYILDDRTNIFKKPYTLSFTGGLATLPSDYFTFDSLRAVGALEDVELLFSGEVSRRLGSYIDAPDALYPACEILENKIKIYPSTISSATLIAYRYPLNVNFDYFIDADGNIVYMPQGTSYTLQAGEIYRDGTTSGEKTSTSVELEWADPQKIDILWLSLKSLGINLGRNDLFGVADKIQSEGK